MRRFEEKTVLVTGSTTGIGEATVREFAAEGAQVMITGRNAERGKKVLAEIKAQDGNADFLQADIKDSSACDKLVEETVKRFGRLDILVNNAGVLYTATVPDTTDEQWHDTFGVNVAGLFFMSRAAIRQMRKQGGGIIVNVASESGLNGEPGLGAYCASKGAVVQLTKCMALDHTRENIRVNAVCPGETHTQMIADWLSSQGGDIDKLIRDLAAGLPINRLAEPREVARCVLFLASDDASYCVGTNMSCDGGNAATGGPYPL